VTVLAAQTPDKPDAPVTTRILDYVRIDWSVPKDNGSPILGYQIKILTSDHTSYATDLLNCDGSKA